MNAVDRAVEVARSDRRVHAVALLVACAGCRAAPTAAPQGGTSEPDCDALVDAVAPVPVDGAFGSYDLAFTADGRAIGAAPDDNSLFADVRGEDATLFLPNTGAVTQMAELPGGDFALLSPIGGVVRVSPDATPTFLAPDVRGFGLVLGPDGQLWTADGARIERVDPDSGAVAIWSDEGFLPAGGPRVLAFLGDDLLLVGTEGGTDGTVFTVDASDPEMPGSVGVFATGVGTGDHHDALAVDACGYAYVADYDTASLYRISPAGDVVVWYDGGARNGPDYAHGLAWGTGVGGWRSDALYLTLPFGGNAVRELVVGVGGG